MLAINWSLTAEPDAATWQLVHCHWGRPADADGDDGGGQSALAREVRLRSADPADKPLVGPNLLKHRDAMRAFQAARLAGRVKRIAIPDPARLDDEALAGHCKRFVKTNYRPVSTARMGADGAPRRAGRAMRVRGITGLRVADMSAVADINTGNTTAPTMMLGDSCATFIIAA